MINSKKKLIVICGPTAVGKTSFSIALAQKLQSEILSADSRQFYRELKIGTAPPSELELKLVPHHFIGHLSIQDTYNVSMYEKEANNKINTIFNHTNNIVVVGGSGLYINALINGIDDLPDPDDSTRSYLKSIFQNEGIESLRKLLKKLDPEYYLIVDLHNHKRLMRALEVCITSGKTYSSLRKNIFKERNYQTIWVGLERPRNELFDIINSRTDLMINHGLVEEAHKLISFKHLNALNTVGYKELFEYLENKTSLNKAIENIKTNTRRYAKRQLTWFKRIPEINWFNTENKNEIIEFILSIN
ncbi:MAG TPA: tRNA (adenosine(37)-N6)-dimethylallyltransferase MiaA [Bacteroidales bacterium]|nr:tRNA (adenosine(37)-N6)-dimethylallyltransferase MiaA [Bacteroidales bacterium]HQI46686.1 tRNA (adenosine(37)-N6)-dimethylallyltransferase MiaA [Bacteroidales bacterium]